MPLCASTLVAMTANRPLRALTSLSSPKSRPADRFSGNEEPALEELLTDPILGRLLQIDGLTVEDVLAVVTDAKRKLSAARRFAR